MKNIFNIKQLLNIIISIIIFLLYSPYTFAKENGGTKIKEINNVFDNIEDNTFNEAKLKSEKVQSTLRVEKLVGKETGLLLPRFVVLKSNKTNLRKGPGVKYPTVWIYHKKNYPMKVIDEYETWRKLKDIDGTEGWVNENLITGKRSVIIIGNKLSPSASDRFLPPKGQAILFRYPNEQAYPVLRAEFNTIASVKKCDLEWCKVKVGNNIGWIQKINLWGIFSEEII